MKGNNKYYYSAILCFARILTEVTKVIGFFDHLVLLLFKTDYALNLVFETFVRLNNTFCSL